MEPWREEAISDELMHYGIKGMKWKKRKAMSKVESAARMQERAIRAMQEEEASSRTREQRSAASTGFNAHAHAGALRRNGGNKKKAMAYDRIARASLDKSRRMLEGRTYAHNVAEQVKKNTQGTISSYNRQAKRRSALKDSLYGLRNVGEVKVKKNNPDQWTGTRVGKAVSRLEVKARVKAYNTGRKVSKAAETGSKKAKTFVSNLFKKKKKR